MQCVTQNSSFRLALNFFPEILGVVSDEHDERFYQDILHIERHYNGKWSTAMLADFCWSIYRETPIKAMRGRKNNLDFIIIMR